MNIRKLVLFTALAASLVTAQSAHPSENACEEAIGRKLKETKKPAEVVFAKEGRMSIPHGPMTHYAGKGSYAMPDGERAYFDWFCDLNDASGKPTNLHVAVLKTDAPAAGTPPPPSSPSAPPKKEADAPVASPTASKKVAATEGSWMRECQNAVESEIRKKNPTTSQVAFHSGKGAFVSDRDNLLEGDGAFTTSGEGDVAFTYRCIYDEKRGKVSGKAFQRK